jgi:uncharacterized OB-fold protein
MKETTTEDDTLHEYVPVAYNFDDEICGVCGQHEFNPDHICPNCNKSTTYDCAKARC